MKYSHPDMTMENRIHRLGDITEREMEGIMQILKYTTNELREVCEKVPQSCDILETTGRKVDRKKISTTHIH